MSAQASSSRRSRKAGQGGGEAVGSGAVQVEDYEEYRSDEEWDGLGSEDYDQPAEPVKKRARKATKSKVKGKSKVSKKNEGKLAPLLDMPLEIFTEVAGRLDPLTLLYLSRTNKVLHRLFASKSSKSIWQFARSTVDLPDLEADDLTEMAYAAFMFEKVCSICEKERAGIVNYDLGRRFCKARPLEYLNPQHYFSIVYPKLVVHPRTLECCLRTQKSHNPNGFDWYFMGEVFVVNEALTETQAMIEDPDVPAEQQEEMRAELAEFVAQRKARVAASQSDARALEALANANAAEREEAVKEAKRQRREAIIAKLEELGLEEREYTAACPCRLILTWRIGWQRVSSDLVAHVEANRDARLELENNFDELYGQGLLSPYYNSMLAAQTAINDVDNLPPLEEFVHLPAVAQFWQDDPHTELNDESWTAAGPAILQEIKVKREGQETAADADSERSG
ncbi:hypothetical protein JCM11251_002505 [Rhodosporidiobolus azoricus]